MQAPSLAFFSPKTAGFLFPSNIPGYAAIEYGPRKDPRPEAAKKRGRSTRTISGSRVILFGRIRELALYRAEVLRDRERASSDRKSTRLNSSHLVISYAVFCLKKKKRQ